ncbi:MAG: PrgI family protein [Oceanospirillaceae bacterium]|nr:PrgI family protein [Oceanospirillaceae bacterium]
MRRLFYVTNDLDDAEEISDEVHAAGIDDHHFYVISRDANGLKTHHLHGSPRLEKTHIIAAGERSAIMFIVPCVIAVLLYFFTDIFTVFDTQPLLIIAVVLLFFLIWIFSKMAKSFDSYFLQMFRQRLNDGEVVIIIDVAKDQSQQIEAIMNTHAKAHFIADSSNLGSPIPD